MLAAVACLYIHQKDACRSCVSMSTGYGVAARAIRFRIPECELHAKAIGSTRNSKHKRRRWNDADNPGGPFRPAALTSSYNKLLFADDLPFLSLL